MIDGETCDPFEESRQVQAGDDQHHGEQEHQRGEVDALDAAFGENTPKTNISTAPIMAMAGRSIFVPGRRPIAKTR